jgi:hypothetical protein
VASFFGHENAVIASYFSYAQPGHAGDDLAVLAGLLAAGRITAPHWPARHLGTDRRRPGRPRLGRAGPASPEAVTVPARAHRTGVRLDLPGTVLGSGGIAALVYGLGQAVGASWGSAGVVIPLATAVIALAAFVMVQACSAHLLLPLRILASRNRGGAYMSIALAITVPRGQPVSRAGVAVQAR